MTMKTVFVFLIAGFEEIEAVATIDILRRAGMNVKTVSLTGALTVVGSHAVPVTADMLFEDLSLADAEMLVLPGGTPAYSEHKALGEAIAGFYGRGGKVAAICASPMVFGKLGILKGRKATCYPGFEKYLEGATLCTEEAVVVDGNVVTGRGPGLTVVFALTLVEILAGKAKRDEIAAQLLVG